MAEMKYLTNQETDNIMLPLVHVNGIVGLNINQDNSTKVQTVNISGEYFSIDAKLYVYQYDNIVTVSLIGKLTNDGIEYLRNGNTIELTISALNNTEFVVLDSVLLTAMEDPAIGAYANVYVSDGKLYISCNTKSVSYSINVDGTGIEEIEEEVVFANIYANGTTTTKSFAPIKPSIPYSDIYFTYPARTAIVVYGPIYSLREVEFTISSEDADVLVTHSNGYYTLNFSNQVNDTFTVRARGNFKSFVYSGIHQVLRIVLENCYNLEWFSINEPGDEVMMQQQSMLESFAIIGRHRMTDMSNFFNGCYKLVSIDEMETTNVKNFESFLEGCIALIKFPSINMINAVNVKNMCKGCTSMTSIMDNNSLSLPEATDCYGMLFDCTSLTTIAKIDAPKANIMASMLWNCNSLETVNSINCQSVTDADDMLGSCTSLIDIKCKNLTVSIDARDTKILDFEGLLNFINHLGEVPEGRTARVYLPQPIEMYFEDPSQANDIVAAMAARNWEIA